MSEEGGLWWMLMLETWLLAAKPPIDISKCFTRQPANVPRSSQNCIVFIRMPRKEVYRLVCRVKTSILVDAESRSQYQTIFTFHLHPHTHTPTRLSLSLSLSLCLHTFITVAPHGQYLHGHSHCCCRCKHPASSTPIQPGDP